MASWHHKWNLTIVHQTQWSGDLQGTSADDRTFDIIKMVSGNAVLRILSRKNLCLLCRIYLCWWCEGCPSLSLFVPESCSTCCNDLGLLRGIVRCHAGWHWHLRHAVASTLNPQYSANKSLGEVYVIRGGSCWTWPGLSPLLIVCWVWRWGGGEGRGGGVFCLTSCDDTVNSVNSVNSVPHCFWPGRRWQLWPQSSLRVTGLGRDNNTRCRLIRPDTSQVYQQSSLYFTSNI